MNIDAYVEWIRDLNMTENELIQLFTQSQINIQEVNNDNIILALLSILLKNDDLIGFILQKLDNLLQTKKYKLNSEPIKDLIANYVGINQVSKVWNFLTVVVKNGIDCIDSYLDLCIFMTNNRFLFSNASKDLITFLEFFVFYSLKSTNFLIPNDLSLQDENLDNYSLVGFHKEVFYLLLAASSMIDNNENAQEILFFMENLLQRISICYNEFVPNFCQAYFEFINDSFNNIYYLKLLICFIDTLEGRIDFSKFAYPVLKYSSNVKSLRIYQDSTTFINLSINTHKTKLFSLQNVVSAIGKFPLKSFTFNSNTLENIKSIFLIIDMVDNNKINDFNSFPSSVLSVNSVYDFFLNNIKQNNLPEVYLKLLHRLKPPPFLNEFSLQDFYNKIFAQNISKIEYQFYTEYLLFLINTKNNDISKNSHFQEFTYLLFQSIIHGKYPLENQTASISIISNFHNIQITNDDISSLLEILFSNFFVNNDKIKKLCVKLIFFLEKNINKDKFEIKHFRQLKTLVMYYSLETEKSIKNIVSSIKNEEIFVNLIDDFIENLNDYTNFDINVKSFIHEIFTKNNNIAFIIHKHILSKIEGYYQYENYIINNMAMLCDILCEIYKIQKYDPDFAIEFFIGNLIDKNDYKLFSSILNFLKYIPNSQAQQQGFLISLLIYEFPSLDIDFSSPFSGLINLGSTCYINSIIQQLSSINDVFISLICETINQAPKPIRSDHQELKIILAYMNYSKETVVDTSRYCEEYSKYYPNFDPFKQEDAEEYFTNLINDLPESIIEIFQGETSTIITDENMSFISSNNENFITINLDLKAGINKLEESLQDFTSFEDLQNENQYTNKMGKKINAIKHIEFKKLPKIIVFFIKRFTYSNDSQEFIKNCSEFLFPTKINMSPFLENSGNYLLRGVVLHKGQLRAGHYTSIIKTTNDMWLLYDDTEITTITEEVMLSLSYGGNCNSSTAYLLFYEREI